MRYLACFLGKVLDCDSILSKKQTSRVPHKDAHQTEQSRSENPDFDRLNLGFSVGAAVQVQQRQAAKTKQHFENIQVHCF